LNPWKNKITTSVAGGWDDIVGIAIR